MYGTCFCTSTRISQTLLTDRANPYIMNDLTVIPKLELSAHHIRRHSQHPWEVFHKRLHFHRRPQQGDVLGEATPKVEGLRNLNIMILNFFGIISEDIQGVPSFKFYFQSFVGESDLPGYHQLRHPSHPNQPNPRTKGTQTHTALGTGSPMLCRVLDI